MEYYAKGKRSLIYKDGNTIIKVEKEGIQAVERIRNEAKWLKKLNKHGIGPKFYKREGKKLHMEYIDGNPILKYKETATPAQLRRVLTLLLDQCREMDKLLVSKFEMTRPTKHVIVRENKPVLIDFERCKDSLRPKNVTQVCQFLTRYFGIEGLLEKAKKYKGTYSERDYKEIRKCLTNTT